MAQPIHGTIGKVQFNNYHTEIREIINNYFQNVDNFWKSAIFWKNRIILAKKKLSVKVDLCIIQPFIYRFWPNKFHSAIKSACSPNFHTRFSITSQKNVIMHRPLYQN